MTASLDELRLALGERYALDRQIGRGGMANVYLAQDLRFGRPVAVKVLRPDLAASLGPDRFLREIETAARLQHPHILPVYDSGGSGQILYYVMPFVEGESLRARLEREHRLPLPEVLRIGREVGEALAFAHSRNVVHRDIKPENILLHGGHAMVVDFGIAKAIQDAGDVRLTQTGLGIGTPAYMSPEQAFSDAPLDGRCDQYSLACVLYELLVGELPFTGNTAVAIMANKSTREARSMRAVRDTVPATVEASVLRALSGDSAARFPSMEAFLQALAGEPGPAIPGLPAQRGTEPQHAWSIAVLPFLNLSSDPENEYLSDGISEELIHALAKVTGLRVVARTSAFAFKGKSQDVRTIGAELRVRAVLEGSVRRSGDRLRVTTQLIDASNGFELWSERFDRQLTDVFAVQEDISRAIVATLQVTLFGEPTRLVRPPTADMAAYEAYLKGRFQWSQRTETGLLEGLRSIGHAVELDPRFTLAQASLAEVYATLSIYGVLPPDEAMQAARAAAERALQADPSSAEALTARGSVRALYDWDWAAAERDFLAAATANPQYPTTHQWFAMHCLAPRGRFAEARDRLTRAQELDPLSPAIAASAGMLHAFESNPAKAIEQYRQVLERHPGFGPAHYFHGLACIQLERYAEAIEALTLAGTLTAGSPEVDAALAMAHGRAGHLVQARSGLDRLLAKAATRYVSPVLMAQVHLGLADVDAALAALEQGLAVHASEMALLEVRAGFEGLRGAPRFECLLEAVAGAGR